MNSKKLSRILAAASVATFIALLAGVYMIQSTLKERSKDIVDKRATIIKLEQEQTSLIQARKDVQKYQYLSDIAESIVPQDKDQAQTVREIVKIASDSGVSLGSVTFPTSTLGQDTTTGSSTTKTPATKPGLSQLTPVKGMSGVYLLQITVTSDTQKPVTYDKLLSFLRGLESNRRTALVSNISINPDKKNRSAIAFTLTLDEYIRP